MNTVRKKPRRGMEGETDHRRSEERKGDTPLGYSGRTVLIREGLGKVCPHTNKDTFG
jgi:hypothetical protein